MRNSRTSTLAWRHPLPVFAVLSLAAYLALRFWFPLSPYYNHSPLPDIRSFTPSLWEGLGYAIWLTLVYGLYLWAARRLKHDGTTSLSLFTILLAALAFGLPLLQTFPVNATDVYRYVIRGRVSSAYGQNPFEKPPDAFPDDPLLPLAGEWAGATSPYGPLWELTAAAVTEVSGQDLYQGLVLFKLLGLLAHLGVAVLIWHLSAEMATSERYTRTLLWAWNPALLLTFVMDAHNDVLMLFWLLLGWLVAKRGRPTMGFAIMVLGALTKPIGLLPLPFLFVYLWRRRPDRPAKANFALLSMIGGLGIVFLAFLPFGSPLALAERLMTEAGTGGGFSIVVLIVLVALRLGLAVDVNAFSSAATLIFGLVLAWLLWRTWRGRSAVRGAADAFIAYIYQALNFRIWYTVWSIPLALIDINPDGAAASRLRVGLWLLLTAQLSVLIYGHLRVYALAGDHFPAHLIGVPFTFGAPYLLARAKRGQALIPLN